MRVRKARLAKYFDKSSTSYSMVLRLRLSLHGHRNHKTFRLDVVPARRRRDGQPIEVLGMWDPRTPFGETTRTVRLSVDRIRYWLGMGAKPSKKVQWMLDLAGIKPDNKAAKSSHDATTEPTPASQPAQSS
ncbi:ribosomal protein S16 [Daedalea quercina L-15889]|uniref:Ribosomal protein S16 n=1 Tax=Daedalea quercina L-15889 TaxID=1314783 RepID=A0A165UM55_9APHY|nr:ribosomal protein S16 [Daedalea quercina L-15889]